MQHLFRPVDIASLVFFRVVFGLLGFADMLGVWTYQHLYLGCFNPDLFQFKYIGFEWARPLPEPLMSLVFLALMAAALLIAAGRWYRACTVVFTLGFTYVFLLEKSLYLNHGYLFCWLSFVMIFLPANRNWSLDVANNPSLRSESIERWSLWVLPFLMGVVYFYGGLAKLDGDWLAAKPLKIWLRNSHDMPLLGWLWKQEATAYAMAWSGALLDLSAPFLLMFPKTRLWALGALLFFHLTNTLVFQIGIFPWLSLALSLLFFPPDLPRRWWAFFKRKIKRLERVEAWWEVAVKSGSGIGGQEKLPPNYPKKAVVAGLVLLCAFHLLVPLRHHFFRGDVAWTEEGHRFAWRMMLRSKSGRGYFTVEDVRTGKSEKVRPEEHLTERQAEKMFTHPDMILQFAHHLRDLRKASGAGEVKVFANIRASLNGRPMRPFADAKADLAQEKWLVFKSSPWVMPFE